MESVADSLVTEQVSRLSSAQAEALRVILATLQAKHAGMAACYPRYLIERFWSSVSFCSHGPECVACCWPWMGGVCRGYGTFFVPKAHRVGRASHERANRFCWRLIYGAIPCRQHVLHDCPAGDNPLCINYHHLWLGTPDDNQKDSMRKGTRPTGDKHGLRLHPEARCYGSSNPAAVLTEQEIYAIRTYGHLGYTQADIAAQFQVSRAHIGLILQRKVWDHLPVHIDNALVQQLGPPPPRRSTGEGNPQAKLTATEVAHIRRLREEGQMIRQIAAQFQVSESLIGLIVRGKIWQHREPVEP